VEELLTPEWLKFGFAGLTSLLFLALLIFLLLAMKILREISNQCHATSNRMMDTMKTSLEAATLAIKDNTAQLAVVQSVVEQLNTYLIKHNGG
jgi:nucleoside permease NupC